MGVASGRDRRFRPRQRAESGGDCVASTIPHAVGADGNGAIGRKRDRGPASASIARRAYLGVALGARPLPPRLARGLGRHSGVEVVEVVPDGPAANAGVRAGDLIVALDQTAIEDVPTLQRLMTGDLIDAPVTMTVARDETLV